MRKRSSWDWVGDVPVFVYTTFLTHFTFRVDILLGKKEDAPRYVGVGPNDPHWKSYVQKGMASKDEVVTRALRNTRHWLKERK